MHTLSAKSWYKWVIAAVSFITVMIALGLCSSSKGLFLAPVTDALGIHRSVYSITDTIRYATTAVINLFFSVLVAKLGAKRMMIFGVLSLMISMLLYSVAPAGGTILTYSSIYGAGFFLGLGLAWCTTTLVGYVVGKWFTKDRGTVMGIILAANGLGNAIATKTLNPVIISDRPISFLPYEGFRVAYWLIAAMLVAIVVLLLIFFRESPAESLGQQAEGKKRRGRQWVGFEWKTVLRKYYFYISAVCIFLTGMALQSISSVSKAHLTQVFEDEDFVTTIMAVYALCLCGTKFLSGFCYDKFGLRVTMLFCDATAAISIAIMALVTKAMPEWGFAAKVVVAFAMPLETVMLPLIAADMFGEKCFPKIMGLYVSINTAGYAVGAPLTNLVYDKVQSYRPILLAFAVMMGIITIVEQINLYHASKDRATVLASLESNEA